MHVIFYGNRMRVTTIIVIINKASFIIEHPLYFIRPNLLHYKSYKIHIGSIIVLMSADDAQCLKKIK